MPEIYQLIDYTTCPLAAIVAPFLAHVTYAWSGLQLIMANKFLADIRTIVGGHVTVFVVSAISAAFFGLPVKWLWNWLMPELFGIKQITFLQAAGFTLLCRILGYQRRRAS